MIETLTQDDFSKHLEQQAKIRLSGGETVEAKLVEVVGMGSEKKFAKGRRQAFSVLFRGPEDAVLEQGIYKVELPETGEVDLFLVTVGPDPETGGMCYEAVFY